MGQITALVIWRNYHFVGKSIVPQTINCNLLAEGLKIAYLLPPAAWAGQDEYTLSFANPKNIPGAIKGVFLMENGVPMILDAKDVQSVNAACGACCGDAADTNVAAVYNGVFPTNQAPTPTLFTVVRTDDGGSLAQNRFQVDYMAFIIDGSLSKTVNGDGTTTYKFNAFKDPRPVGTDVITETPRVFLSANVPAHDAAKKYVIDVTVGADTTSVEGADDTLAAAVAAATANATLGAYGTWAVNGTKVQLTTTKVDDVTILVTQSAT